MKETGDYADFYKTAVGMEVLRREAEYVRRHLQGCNRILDVGCGPGVFERELDDMNILGVDVDGRMIDVARKNSGNAFIRTPAEKLPFADGSFDCVFFVTSLEFMEELEQPLDEVVRVLTDAGKVTILVLNPQSDYFKQVRERGGYIARNIRHTDLEGITTCVSDRFDVEEEYFLGIKNGRVFDTDKPSEAAIYAIEGRL